MKWGSPLGDVRRVGSVAALLALVVTAGESLAQMPPAADGVKPTPADAPTVDAGAAANPTPSAAPAKGAPDTGAMGKGAMGKGAIDAAAKQPGEGMELPPWHPPIPQPAEVPIPTRRQQRDDGRAMLEALQREAAAAQPRPTRDAEGYCIGRGPNDPPQNVNLFHGWLGVNNDKAVAAPPRRGGPGWFGEEYLGSLDWWKWRLTPYPYRYENNDDECDPRNQPIPLLANLINFGALLFLFVRFGKKPIAEALKKRKWSVMAEIERAREIKERAHKRLDEYRSGLDNLDERLATLREQYALEGETEEKRLRSEITETASRLLTDADFRVDQEGKMARDKLSSEALEEALAAAETLVRDSVQDADHQRLADEFLKDLGPTLQSWAEEERTKG